MSSPKGLDRAILVSMVKEFTLSTGREGFYNITSRIRQALEDSDIQNGIAVIFCPHTTAGITINENADPDVVIDMLFALRQTYPDRPEFRHAEGNTTAQLKASAMGSSATVIVQSGRLVLGTWQGIYFCEFDGPRNRTFLVKILEG